MGSPSLSFTVSGLVRTTHNNGHTSPRDHYARWGFAKFVAENDEHWATAWVDRGCPTDEIWEPESGLSYDEQQAKRQAGLNRWAYEQAKQDQRARHIADLIDESNAPPKLPRFTKIKHEICDWIFDELLTQLTKLPRGWTSCIRAAQAANLITNIYNLTAYQRAVLNRWIENETLQTPACQH